jgi:hypothetical protein
MLLKAASINLAEGTATKMDASDRRTSSFSEPCFEASILLAEIQAKSGGRAHGWLAERIGAFEGAKLSLPTVRPWSRVPGLHLRALRWDSTSRSTAQRNRMATSEGRGVVNSSRVEGDVIEHRLDACPNIPYARSLD